VVDAPDAKLNSEYSVNPSNYHHPNLSLASGATALGSVKPRHLSQLQPDPLLGSQLSCGFAAALHSGKTTNNFINQLSSLKIHRLHFRCKQS